jgi:soluble lytic murein transglycosylase-like protein
LATATVAAVVPLSGPPRAALAQATAPMPASATQEGVDTREIIVRAAGRWGVDPDLMLAIAACESNLNPNAVGPDGAAGLFQIAPRTWQWGVETLGLGSVSPLDPQANAEVAAWLLATLGPGQWGCP